MTPGRLKMGGWRLEGPDKGFPVVLRTWPQQPVEAGPVPLPGSWMPLIPGCSQALSIPATTHIWRGAESHKGLLGATRRNDTLRELQNPNTFLPEATSCH